MRVVAHLYSKTKYFLRFLAKHLPSAHAAGIPNTLQNAQLVANMPPSKA